MPLLESYLNPYAAAGVMMLTAVPAGGIPTATALIFASAAQADDVNPDAPWSAWLVVVAVVVGVLVVNVASVMGFLWLLRRLWRMPRDARWFNLGRGAWLVLSACCFGVGTACGVAFAVAVGAIPFEQ